MIRQDNSYQIKLVLTAAALLFGFSCTSPAHKSKADSVAAVTATKKDSAAAANRTWVYTQSADNLSSRTDYFAADTATNMLDFKPPYDGGTSAVLTIRHLSGKNRLTLAVTKGRFTSNNPDGQKVRIKFDNGKPAIYSCDPGSEANVEVIYIHPANGLIEKIKRVKTITIEAEFLNEGLQRFIFNVGGLKWNHKSVYIKS